MPLRRGRCRRRRCDGPSRGRSARAGRWSGSCSRDAEADGPTFYAFPAEHWPNGGDLRQPAFELLDGVAHPPAGRIAIAGDEDGADDRAQRVVLIAAHMAAQVAQEVHGAALSRRAEHLSERRLSPEWASLMATCTPPGPRLMSERRKSRQKLSVSVAPTSRPMISRRPVSWTPWATTRHLGCTSPPAGTFSCIGAGADGDARWA
jgi:hypothetical protein